MTLETLRAAMPDFAKDTKINLIQSAVGRGQPRPSPARIFGTALACAYATNTRRSSRLWKRNGHAQLDTATVQAARAPPLSWA